LHNLAQSQHCLPSFLWLASAALRLHAAQANELIEVKKQQLAEARVWRQQQEEYEVRLLMLLMFSGAVAQEHGLSVVVCMCPSSKAQ
jgi:hypothetical protein